MAAASRELGPQTRRMAIARYMSSHFTAARAERARTYAAKLGLKGLGRGLRPVGD